MSPKSFLYCVQSYYIINQVTLPFFPQPSHNAYLPCYRADSNTLYPFPLDKPTSICETVGEGCCFSTSVGLDSSHGVNSSIFLVSSMESWPHRPSVTPGQLQDKKQVMSLSDRGGFLPLPTWDLTACSSLGTEVLPGEDLASPQGQPGLTKFPGSV